MVEVELIRNGVIWGEYHIRYKNITLELWDWVTNDTVKCVKINTLKIITNNFQDYFIDWLHPTEEEFIAFCLEHNLEY